MEGGCVRVRVGGGGCVRVCVRTYVWRWMGGTVLGWRRYIVMLYAVLVEEVV